MGKRKFRPGSQIRSLDEAARQKHLYFCDKIVNAGWFRSWQFGWVDTRIKYGEIQYAMPNGVTTRFSDEDVIRAERRLRTEPTHEGRSELIHLLNRYDRGSGDIDDVIDRIEDEPGN